MTLMIADVLTAAAAAAAAAVAVVN